MGRRGVCSAATRDEDALVGALLSDAGHPLVQGITLLDQAHPLHFDVNSSDPDQQACEHTVGAQATNPHKMKTDEAYQQVGLAFDDQ